MKKYLLRTKSIVGGFLVCLACSSGFASAQSEPESLQVNFEVYTSAGVEEQKGLMPVSREIPLRLNVRNVEMVLVLSTDSAGQDKLQIQLVNTSTNQLMKELQTPFSGFYKKATEFENQEIQKVFVKVERLLN